jgi:hypothetical protein
MYITEPHADIMAFLGPPGNVEQREQDARLFTSGAHLPCGALSGGESRCVQPTVRARPTSAAPTDELYERPAGVVTVRRSRTAADEPYRGRRDRYLVLQ